MSAKELLVELSADAIVAQLVEEGEVFAEASVVYEGALSEGLVTYELSGEEAVQRDIEAILRAFRAAVVSVCGEERGLQLSMLVLNPKVRSVLAVGRENVRLTPALFLRGREDLPMPPSRYLPEHIVGEVRRYVSVEAWLVNWLTREWIGLQNRAPLGLPTVKKSGNYAQDRGHWEEARAVLTHSPLLVPEGTVMAQIQPMRAKVLEVAPYTPITGRLG